MASVIQRSDIDAALSRLTERALRARKWHSAHVLAHVEAELFGYDPDCPAGCPLA